MAKHPHRYGYNRVATFGDDVSDDNFELFHTSSGMVFKITSKIQLRIELR
jgi:hypothetical protein